MAITWTLKDATGANLTHQPAAGSPLALKFDSSGYTHLSGYASEVISSCEVSSDASTVTITLTPDTAGDTLSQSLSNPTKNPTTHTGTLSWTSGAGGLTTLVFSVPPVGNGSTFEWDCGSEPPVGLKSKYKLKRGM